jgi:hypothetical protein
MRNGSHNSFKRTAAVTEKNDVVSTASQSVPKEASRLATARLIENALRQ